MEDISNTKDCKSKKMPEISGIFSHIEFFADLKNKSLKKSEIYDTITTLVN